jgi:hypothetical protein
LKRGEAGVDLDVGFLLISTWCSLHSKLSNLAGATSRDIDYYCSQTPNNVKDLGLENFARPSVGGIFRKCALGSYYGECRFYGFLRNAKINIQ